MSRLIDMADAWVLSRGNESDTINNNEHMKANIEINTDEIIAAIKDPGFIDLLYKFTKVAKEYLAEEKQKLAAAQLQIVPDKPKAKELLSHILANAKNGKGKPKHILVPTNQIDKSGTKKIEYKMGKSKVTRNVPIKTKICPECKISFDGPAQKLYCSVECRNKANYYKHPAFTAHTGIKHCPACDQDYKPASNGQKYHNAECKAILQSSESNLTQAITNQKKPRKAINTLVPKVTKVPKVPTVSESHESTPKLSWYQRKKLEEKQQKEEQEMLDSLKEHPKIDWNEAHKEKIHKSEAIPAII